MSTCLTGSSTSSSLPLSRTISGIQYDMMVYLADKRTVLGEPVGPDNLLGLVENVGHVDTNDHLGSGLGSKHRQDTSSTPDLYHQLRCRTLEPRTYIEDGLALEQVTVLHDSVPVGQCPNLILEHFLVNTEMGIRVGIVVSAGHVSYRRQSALSRGSLGFGVHCGWSGQRCCIAVVWPITKFSIS